MGDGLGKVIVLFEGITLGAEVAGDEVHNAFGALGILRHTVQHGIGPGVGVVVAGKDELDACIFNGVRQLLSGLGVHFAVGAEDGLMHHQHLPLAGGLCGIRLQSLQGGEHVRSVVHHRHVHAAVFHGIPAVGL